MSVAQGVFRARQSGVVECIGSLSGLHKQLVRLQVITLLLYKVSLSNEPPPSSEPPKCSRSVQLRKV